MTTAEDARKLLDWILENAGLEAKSLPIAIRIMWMMDSERWEAFQREHTPNNLEEAEGECLLGPRPPAEDECLLSPSPPAEGECLLGPRPPAEDECLLVTLPPPSLTPAREGDKPQSPARKAEPHQSPAREAEQHQSPAKGGDYTLLPPPSPGDYTLLPPSSPRDHTLLPPPLLPPQEPEGEELQAQPPDFLGGEKGRMLVFPSSHCFCC
ncbi:UNVERIFIED_CONTAM: hypothetical protein FKN15_064755 [Acipenser sinensis]